MPTITNSLLHRFYEPLTLLYVLDPTQGDRLSRAGAETSSLEDISRQELRRKFLDALAYVCDYEKGGDTVTAIGITSGPLQYHVSCNKGPEDKVVQFIDRILGILSSAYGQSEQQRTGTESSLLSECCVFSKPRLRVYWRFLGSNLQKCLKLAKNDEVATDALTFIEQKLKDAYANGFAELCTCSKLLQQGPQFKTVKIKAVSRADQGNVQNPFASLKHFVGRLAYHPRSTHLMITAACRLPDLFLGPEIIVVRPQSEPLSLGPRQKTTLKGIVGRIVGSGEDRLASELCSGLSIIDKAFHIEEYLRKEYEEKKHRLRPHAELILLEHFYANQGHINLVDNDRYIGCSKPACYCCFLYIRSHPGHFVEPATHQKIYLNWLPPTYKTGTDFVGSELAQHTRRMLINMNQSVKSRLIEQILSFGGRRQKHFDSVTSDTMSARLGPRFPTGVIAPAGQFHGTEGSTEPVDTMVVENFSVRASYSSSDPPSDDDSASDGGAPLLLD